MRYHHTRWQYAKLDHVNTAHTSNMIDADISSSDFDYSLKEEEIKDIMAGVNVHLNQNNELNLNMGPLVGEGGGMLVEDLMNPNMQFQVEHQHNVSHGEQMAENTVQTGTVQVALPNMSHNPQVANNGGHVGSHLFQFNVIIPQIDGACDDFWEDLINVAEDSFMESIEDLSDINSEASYQSLPIDYSMQINSWPLDQEMPMMNMDIDQEMEASILNPTTILFASSGASTGQAECSINTNFRFSLLSNVYTSKDFMNLFLFKDLLGVQDWANLWPKTTKTMDRVLGRWAYYSQNFMVVDQHNRAMDEEKHDEVGVLIYNVWDGPIQVSMTKLNSLN